MRQTHADAHRGQQAKGPAAGGRVRDETRQVVE